MLKKGLIAGLIILTTFLWVQNVEAEIKTETLKEACETEELTCDFTEEEADDSLPNVYIFRGNGCGYCQRLLTFLASIAEDYQDKVNFVVYEVAQNSDNWDFYEKVGAKFGDTIEGYPYMVIGKKVFNGYASSDNEEIISALDELAESEEPYDVRSEIEAGNLDEVKPENSESNIGAVISFIFGVVVVLVLLMGYTLTKKEPRTIKKTKKA